jgi:dihydroneopterin aldolase
MLGNMDEVVVEGLRLLAKLGARPEERAVGTWIEVDVRVGLAGPAGEEDTLDATVDYTWVASECARLAEVETATLERYAAEAAETVLAHRLARRVEVAARKTAAPARFVAEFGVVVVRERR